MTPPKLITPTDRLGKRQQEVLTHMTRNGGVWPMTWRITYAKQSVFDSLVQRGLIIRDGVVYRLARK